MKIDLISGLILAMAGAAILLILFGKFCGWFVELDFSPKKKKSS
jgi:hypothetical protein